MDAPKPDVIIGIDFGTSGTAVACARVSHGGDIHQITTWPGLDENGETQVPQDKVPTRVAYVDGDVHWGFNATLTSLGFRYDQDFQNNQIFNIEKILKGRFYQTTKLSDADDTDDADDTNDADDTDDADDTNDADDTDDHDVSRYIKDYLHQLRVYIEEYCREQLESWAPNNNWSNAKVRYCFSYPTTWHDEPETRRQFEDLVKKAGYKTYSEETDQDSPSSVPLLSLDEASAVMAYYQWDNSQKTSEAGQAILVADIGGGTSDVSLCTVQKDQNGVDVIKINKASKGIDAGGVHIDNYARDYLRQLLSAESNKAAYSIAGEDADTRERRASQWLHSCLFDLDAAKWYATFKEWYGNNKLKKASRLMRFPSPLRYSINNATGSTHSREQMIEITVRRDEMLHEPFKRQCELVLKQITDLVHSSPEPETQPKKLVLAGGLGSCDRVVKFLRGHSKEISRSLAVSRMTKPMHAVSRGLVQNELRKIQGLGYWCCQASATYGIKKGDSNSNVKIFLRKGQEIIVPPPQMMSIGRQVRCNEDGSLKDDLSLVINGEYPNHTEKMPATSRVLWDEHWQEVVDLGPTIKKSGWESSSGLLRRKEKADIQLQIQPLHSALRLCINNKPLIHIYEMWHLERTRVASRPHRYKGGSFKFATWGFLGLKVAVALALAAVGISADFGDETAEPEP